MSQSGIVLPTTSEKERREELAAECDALADVIEAALPTYPIRLLPGMRDKIDECRARAATLRKNAP